MTATRSSTGRRNSPGRGGPVIVAEDLTVGYELFRERQRLTALVDVNLTVGRGEFVVLVGPSGCGKTTFINAISGLVKPWKGRVLVNGQPVAGPGPDRAMVFQDYALMPWRTVESNIRLAFELQHHKLSERRSTSGSGGTSSWWTSPGSRDRSPTSCREG